MGTVRDAVSRAWGMITCVVEYVIDPAKIDAFERFGRRWIELVDSHGGTHGPSCGPCCPGTEPGKQPTGAVRQRVL